MNIAICDDDPLATKLLYNLLNEYITAHHYSHISINTYSSGEELLKSSHNHSIIFLDIEMPGVDGIFVGNQIASKYPKAIILVVTSYMEYLDDAMRFHVFRYISKPVDKLRLYNNLDDAFKEYKNSLKSIALECKDGAEKVAVDSIISIECIAKKVTVYTTRSEYHVTQPLDYFIRTLDTPNFIQTHRSYIVNLAYVNKFTNDLVYLDNNRLTAYLTRRRFKDFKLSFLNYIEDTKGGLH